MASKKQNRDTLEYFDKIFRLGVQLATAANNLGVLGIAAANTPLNVISLLTRQNRLIFWARLIT